MICLCSLVLLWQNTEDWVICKHFIIVEAMPGKDCSQLPKWSLFCILWRKQVQCPHMGEGWKARATNVVFPNSCSQSLIPLPRASFRPDYLLKALFKNLHMFNTGMIFFCYFEIFNLKSRAGTNGIFLCWFPSSYWNQVSNLCLSQGWQRLKSVDHIARGWIGSTVGTWIEGFW